MKKIVIEEEEEEETQEPNFDELFSDQYFYNSNEHFSFIFVIYILLSKNYLLVIW